MVFCRSTSPSNILIYSYAVYSFYHLCFLSLLGGKRKEDEGQPSEALIKRRHNAQAINLLDHIRKHCKPVL